MTDPKPCPFCKGEAELMRHLRMYVWWVQCTSCGARSKQHTGKDGSEAPKKRAIADWDRREGVGGEE
jgi:hypothetical protein